MPADPPDQKGSLTSPLAVPDPPAAQPGSEPASAGHWLYRLTAEQWLAAAENELQAARAALLGKQQRTGVTHARRAAGMALNASLRLVPDESYGRSYMEHLQALHKDPAASPELREAALRLLTVPIVQTLVTLGPKGDTTPADFAARIFAYAQAVVARHQSAAPHRPDDSTDDSTAG